MEYIPSKNKQIKAKGINQDGCKYKIEIQKRKTREGVDFILVPSIHEIPFLWTVMHLQIYPFQHTTLFAPTFPYTHDKFLAT